MAVGDILWKAGTETTLQNADGASVSTGAYQQATTANITTAVVGGMPFLSFEAAVAYASAPAIGTVIDIYLRPINFESTNDAETPQADYQQVWVGSLKLNDVTTTQYIKTPPMANPMPLVDCEVYICNRTAQTLSANWTLKYTPMTYTPATS